MANPAPIKNIAPIETLNLVNKSALFCTVNTLPLSKLPSSSSNLTVTVASPGSSGNRLCQTISVDFKAAKKIANGEEVAFAGEMSDGAHNLGFSQYVSIFHSASQDFREYSDKMASYLFGPTFLNQLIDGKHEQDPVWKIFMEYHTDTIFDKLKSDYFEVYNNLGTISQSLGEIDQAEKNYKKAIELKHQI